MLVQSWINGFQIFATILFALYFRGVNHDGLKIFSNFKMFICCHFGSLVSFLPANFHCCLLTICYVGFLFYRKCGIIFVKIWNHIVKYYFFGYNPANYFKWSLWVLIFEIVFSFWDLFIRFDYEVHDLKTTEGILWYFFLFKS